MSNVTPTPKPLQGPPKNIVWRLIFLGGVADVLGFLLLFIPAGTFDFWQAWVYWGLFTAYLVIGTAWWYRIDPDFMERRLKVGPRAEKIAGEKINAGILIVYLCFWVTIPGFDRRFHWSDVPLEVVIAGFVFSILGLAFVVYTAVHNRYMAATITVEENQPVISTGPYAWVRHPMYTGTLVWFFVTPLALGSYWGILAAIPMPIILLFRIFNEEKHLRENLLGYTEYCQKVKYRLLPFIW